MEARGSYVAGPADAESSRGLRGGTGTIFSDGEDAVVKCMKLSNNPMHLVKVLCELIVGFLIPEDSACLCPVREAWIESPGGACEVLYTRMPRFAGDLVDLINLSHGKKMEVSSDLAEYVAAGTLRAMHELASVLGPRGCHSDLKLDNIMIDGDGNVRVIDYGHARSEKFLDRRMRLLAWRPMEPFESGSKADSWSVAMLMVVMISSKCR